MVHTDYSDYIPVSDLDWVDEYEHLEEEVVREKNARKLGNAFKQSQDGAI
jgi:hypothetical protein